MKKAFLLLGLVFLVSLNIFSQLIPEIAPLNPDFVQYMNEVNSGLRKTITNDGHGLGEIPSPLRRDFSAYVNTKADIADPLYDLRTAGPGGTSLLTSVKDQGDCGSCWTFAAMGSIESRWKILGHGTNDLSEDNMNNCHGFELAACTGGNINMTAAYLSRKTGPFSETDDPYTASPNSCPGGLSEVGYVNDICLLPKVTNTLKQALIDYGALYTNMRWEDASYNIGNNTYFYGGASSNSTNHAVLLVGWDNNKVTAGGTGAWIIRNSWGDTWGESGFFYVSYSDTKINTTPGYYPSRIEYNSNAYVYAYDELGSVSSVGYGEISYGLVKYVATANQQISKIGTWLNASSASVDIEIYDSFNGTTLSSLLGSLSSQTRTLPGYYTFDLSSPISISAGNDFYIKIKYNTPLYNWPIPIETASTGYAAPTIETGKCWISSSGANGNWTAIGTGTSNLYDVCIKAYAVGDMSNPTSFTATPVSTNQINLSWVLNTNNDDVMVAYNTTNTFGVPTDGVDYNLSDVISGGGTVIYNGANTSFNHTLLNSGTIYYYKAWSKDGSKIYSNGVIDNAQTVCSVITILPELEDFTAASSPICWELIDYEGDGQVWQFGTITTNGLLGTTGNYAYLNSDAYGSGYTQNTDLITPTFDLSGYTSVNLFFKHYYRTYTGTSATLSYSINNGASWTIIQQWTTASSANPATFNSTIPALANQSQVKFKWNYTGTWGYYWCVDDISVTATAASSLVVADETLNVSSNMAYQNVTVEHDGNLTIDADKILTVTGDFTIKSDASGTGSFIQNGTLNVAGNIIVQKYLPNTSTSGWTLSTPVQGATTTVFDGCYQNKIWKYNPLTIAWDYLNPGDPLEPMTAYVVRYDAINTVEFNGDLNNGSFSRSNLERIISPDNYGWNYIGNPYPSPIDWSHVGVVRTNVDAAIYYRKSNGQQASWTILGGVNGGTNIVPAMQAFWVKVTKQTPAANITGSVTINNSARTHGANNILKTNPSNVLRLSVDRDSLSDEILIGFKDMGTSAFDSEYDAAKMFAYNNALPQLYSIGIDNEFYGINCLPLMETAVIVPLGFKTQYAGNFSITASDISTFDANVCILLEDLDDNIITDLRQQATYAFTAPVGTTNNRFIVHFNALITDNLSSGSENDINVYTYDKAVYIANVTDNNATVSIYNVLGQEVASFHLISNTLNKVNTSLAAGQYIVKVISNARVISQKVYLN